MPQYKCMFCAAVSTEEPAPSSFSDQYQISPAASSEILHHTVWRTWLSIAQIKDDCTSNSRCITYTFPFGWGNESNTDIYFFSLVHTKPDRVYLMSTETIGRKLTYSTILTMWLPMLLYGKKKLINGTRSGKTKRLNYHGGLQLDVIIRLKKSRFSKCQAICDFVWATLCEGRVPISQICWEKFCVIVWRPAQRITYFDAVVMKVRVGQELIGGVVHVRGQELTHKVAVDGHVVGEAKQVLHAHVSAYSHFVNKERFDYCDVQVLEKVTNKVGKSDVVAPLQVFGGQNFVFGEEVHRENTSKKQSLSYEDRGHGGLIEVNASRFQLGLLSI